MIEIGNKIIIDAYPSTIVTINKNEYAYDQSGRQCIKYEIHINPDVLIAIQWVQTNKWKFDELVTQLSKEAKLRAENPALQSQYEAYTTMMKLVNDEDTDDK